jgi:hypothetical protein
MNSLLQIIGIYIPETAASLKGLRAASQRVNRDVLDSCVTHVCGHCEQETLNSSSQRCKECGCRSILCSKCSRTSVDSDSLGKRSLKRLVTCSECSVGTTSTLTKTSYCFSISEKLNQAFLDPEFCEQLLAPFQVGNSDVPIFTLNQGKFELHISWYEMWVDHLRRQPYYENSCDGKVGYSKAKNGHGIIDSYI